MVGNTPKRKSHSSHLKLILKSQLKNLKPTDLKDRDLMTLCLITEKLKYNHYIFILIKSNLYFTQFFNFMCLFPSSAKSISVNFKTFLRITSNLSLFFLRMSVPIDRSTSNLRQWTCL